MMNHYPIALYLHIVGALGFFMALGLEWASVRAMRRAESVSQVRDWASAAAGAGKVGMPSMLLILLSGTLMTVSVWGAVPWVLVTLGAIGLLIVVTLAISRRRMAAVERAVANEEGMLSPALHALTHHPLLGLAIQLRVAIALGIVYLMTVKPDLPGSLLTIAIAAVLGLGSAMLMQRPKRQAQTIRTNPAAPL